MIFDTPRHYREVEGLLGIELNKMHNWPVGEKPMGLDDYVDLNEIRNI